MGVPEDYCFDCRTAHTGWAVPCAKERLVGMVRDLGPETIRQLVADVELIAAELNTRERAKRAAELRETIAKAEAELRAVTDGDAV